MTGGGRIVIVQERGRHAANREFREALSLQRALTRLGVEAVVWGFGDETFATPLAEVARGADRAHHTHDVRARQLLELIAAF